MQVSHHRNRYGSCTGSSPLKWEHTLAISRYSLLCLELFSLFSWESIRELNGMFYSKGHYTSIIKEKHTCFLRHGEPYSWVREVGYRQTEEPSELRLDDATYPKPEGPETHTALSFQPEVMPQNDWCKEGQRRVSQHHWACIFNLIGSSPTISRGAIATSFSTQKYLKTLRAHTFPQLINSTNNWRQPIHTMYWPTHGLGWCSQQQTV